MALGKELRVIVVGDASKLAKELGKAGQSAQSFGDRMKHVGKSMTIAGAAITGVAVIVGKQLVDAALAAETAEAKLDKSLANAGISAIKSAKAIDQAKTAGRDLGFTNIQTVDSLQKLVQGGDNVKQSMTDLALAQDYARATGRDLTTATASIVKVHQGLLRPLKELGVSLPQVTDHMKALTAAHKKSGDAITATEKALAFQQDKEATGAQAVQLMTDKLHGQAKAFSDTSAGGMAQFQAKLDGLKESLGKLLLPFLDKAVNVLNKLADAFLKLSPHTQSLIVDIGLAVAAFGAVMLVLGPVIAGIGTLLPIFVALASPIGIVVAAIVLLVAAFVAAVVWPDKLKAALEKMGLSAKQAQTVVDDMRKAVEILKAIFEAVFPVVKTVVVAAITGIIGEIKGLITFFRGFIDVVSGIFHGDWSQVWKGVKEIVSGAIAAVSALIRGWKTILTTLGKLAFEGLLAGIKAYLHIFLAFWSGLGSLTLQALGNLGKLLYSAGIALIQGLWDGVRSAAGGFLSYLGGLASKAKSVFTLGLHGSPELFTYYLGGQLMDDMVKGVHEKEAKVAKALYDAAKKALDAAKQAVTDAKGIFASAFDDLASTALAAFDKVSADFQTKTEKKIAAQDERRAAADRKKALAEANAALAQAQTPLTPNAGESPEDFAARMAKQTEDIKAATQARNDALFAIQRAADEKRAAQERKARDDSRELQRRHFEEQLTTLEAQLEKGRITAVQFRTRLLNLFDKFGVPFRAAGQALGSALAEGLHDSFADAGKAARALIEAIANEIAKAKFVANVQVNVTGGNPGHRAFGGPVSKGSPYIVGEKGPELFVPGSSGKIVPSMSGGGGVAEIHTNVYIDSVQVTELVRREMLRFEKRNGRSAV